MARTEFTVVIDSPIDDEYIGIMVDEAVRVLAETIASSLTQGEDFTLHLNGIPIYEGRGI